MKHRIIQGTILIIFLAGFCMFLYPYLVRWNSENKFRQITSEFKDMISTENKKDELVMSYEDLYRDLQAYNQKIFEEGQIGLGDPFLYETSSFDLKSYGFSENVIGILWIPRLELELPIYPGADNNNMAKGVGILGETSMPLAGENTNIVLAGHRGWKGIPMFRDIQSVQPGDKIQITTPWETLIYRVCELKIIPKDDIEAVYIQKGRELVTLLTCHPYTKNTHRYVVIAERSEEETVSIAEDKEEAVRTKSYEMQPVEVLTKNGVQIEMVSPKANELILNEGMNESGLEYSGRQIWLETIIPYIGMGTVILTAVILWCLTRRNSK